MKLNLIASPLKWTVLSLVLLPGVHAQDKAINKLIDAVKQNDQHAAATFIRQGADVNGAESDGTSALHYAAHLNNATMVTLLLRAGGKANAVNEYGVSVLGEASAAGNASVIASLLAAGASANTTTPDGETVLMTAAQSGNVNAVRLLIEHGAAVNARENWKGQTALMWAAAANHANIALLLIAKGAEIDARSASVVPEFPRPVNGNLVSDQPKGSLTALLFAARQGATDALRILIRAGADLNLADPDGITPLIIAIINGHYDAAAALVEAGANPNLADKWGRTPLYAAIDMNTLEPSTTRPSPKNVDRLGGLGIARMLLDKGAMTNPRLVEATPGRGIPDGPDPLLRAGTTPFLRAAKTGDVAAMRLLLEHGADPTMTTEKGVTALMAAAGQGWRYGDSQIAETDALESVKLCIELGLDVNTVNEKKETALHGAADRGASEIVRYLAAHGANLAARDSRGHTALDVAIGGESMGHPGYPNTAALLRDLIAKR